MAKKKSAKVGKNFASISMSINGRSFHAEGDKAEVSAKLDQWLAETLVPIRRIGESFRKVLSD